MKTLSIILSMVIVAPLLRAQDETPSDWQIMPSISVVKFFQGEDIVDQNIVYYPTYPAMYPYYDMTGYGYSGTGLNFTARCFNDEIKPLAFTFSGGITWYYQPDHYQYMLTSPAYVNSYIGFLMGHRDFLASRKQLRVYGEFLNQAASSSSLSMACRRRIFVTGEVTHTGPMTLLPHMTMLQALAQAGFTQFANPEKARDLSIFAP